MGTNHGEKPRVHKADSNGYEHPVLLRTFHSSIDSLKVGTTKLLSRSTADEEPLVYRTVNLLRGQVLVGRERGQLIGRDTAGRVANSEVGASSPLVMLYREETRVVEAKRTSRYRRGWSCQ